SAALGQLDDGLGRVDVRGEDVHDLVDQTVGRLGFLDGHRPVTGEDDGRGHLGVHRSRAQRVRIDVAQDLGNRLGGHEAQLAALRGGRGDDAGDVLRLVDVAEIAAHVGGVLALDVQAPTVQK